MSAISLKHQSTYYEDNWVEILFWGPLYSDRGRSIRWEKEAVFELAFKIKFVTRLEGILLF